VSPHYASRHQQLLEDILSQEKSLAAQESRFVQVFYDKLMVDMLEQFAPARALEIARFCYSHVLERVGDDSRIHIETATLLVDGVSSQRVRLVILNPDMPFLVDSISAMLQRLGLRMHILLHPILAVKRDKKGQLTDISMNDDLRADAARESLIYVEISPLPPQCDAGDLRRELKETLAHVRAAVTDWKAMDGELKRVQEHFSPDASHENERALHEKEIHDFLVWLRHRNFVFLGVSYYTKAEHAHDVVLEKDTARSWGVYRLLDAEAGIETSPLPTSSLAFINISKATSMSLVHRSVAMDYIALRQVRDDGSFIGEVRLLGLFTSNVYYQSAVEIPFVREKIAQVLHQAGYDPVSHSGKALKTILEFLPRDEIFQTSVEQLFAIGMGVLTAESYPQVKVFPRMDPFDRFISALIYVPRDRFSTTVREQITRILEKTYGGQVHNFYTHITDSPLARLHLFINKPSIDVAAVYVPGIEEKISALVNVWEDALRDALITTVGEAEGEHLAGKYSAAFDNAYLMQNPAAGAVHDILKMEACLNGSGLELELFKRPGEAASAIHLKCYTTDLNASLSEILPMLEHMGFEVRNATPYAVNPKGSVPLLLRDFALSLKTGDVPELSENKARMEEALVRVWQKACANDALNALVFTTPLRWRDIEILRGYVRYLQQAGISYRTGYVMQVLTMHPRIAALLAELFHARFAPEATGRDEKMAALRAQIVAACEEVSNLTEDRILRRIMAVIMATLRTNFYQTAADGNPKPYLSFKLRSREVPELPLPVPFAEIFVTSPRVEGIHLRGDRVARGGLRWSDRPEDFRTEILGLVKAQTVKNAVIVPSGAKGGFVLRQAPAGRDALQQEGIACYKTFLCGLLDLTDNIVVGSVVPPADVVRHDDDDPYLVVAADKGTASFSDIANGVAADYGFWLGDAFASGGSVGYDHKAMAITARGAWVSVARHFREMGRDVMTEPFTAVGIGDMSGDVFGNGLLLSRQYRLVAAFNHMHIFIDPTPDAEAAFEERARLFALPRSQWSDYNAALISKGGGIYERSAKSIALSEEARRVLSTDMVSGSPDEVIQAILRARVDLLWNGGIGTYVKAESESHDDVGDRSNNALRVDGKSLRCLVVGEGGNLGFTQRGRIEYARTGGRINTDAIDNSAGVDCSDHEVNIKIAFTGTDITRDARDQLLRDMTSEVAHLVLEDNRLQTQALTIAELSGDLESFAQLMRQLEQRGLLNRAVEFLPDDAALAEMQKQKLELTRPELSVLLAYSKMVIARELKADAALRAEDDSALLTEYFPEPMHDAYRSALLAHPLKREILATCYTNRMVNRLGITTPHRLAEETGFSMLQLAQAYRFVEQLFDLPEYWRHVEALEGQVHAMFQVKLFWQLQEFSAHMLRWCANHLPRGFGVERELARFAPGVASLRDYVMQLLQETSEHDVGHDMLNEELASRMTSLISLASACDIIEAAEKSGAATETVAQLYWQISDMFKLDALRLRVEAMPSSSSWQRIAHQAAISELYQAQQRLTLQILLYAAQQNNSHDDVLSQWRSAHNDHCTRYIQTLESLETKEMFDDAMLLVALRNVQWLVSA
jgi:glutamate dehydrogenase